ncbi:MAG TPA: hypothetical protein VLA89_12280 [Gemmatimonadales bacterium]|nr:hypothetical protein [Gemmatimonadales bacterium]
MSTRFTIWCETHEVAGPHIRRHHQGAFLLGESTARFFPALDKEQASRDWGGFLIEHEFCDLRLRYELARALAREKREREEAEARKPTHELMEDGSLRPL